MGGHLRRNRPDSLGDQGIRQPTKRAGTPTRSLRHVICENHNGLISQSRWRSFMFMLSAIRTL